jgi:gamma-glutamylcyclotransferase (GGCT)/AIG2-like uncharacterized protein YtfP
MQNIFVYGTLQSPEIIKKLTGKSFKNAPAVLEGYKLYCVKECDYPAIIQQEGAKTDGLVMANMDDVSLALISFYEGDEYEKRQVTVKLNGKSVDAFTFIWVKEIEFLENKEWDFLNFKKNRLEHYINVVIPDTLEEFFKK